MVALTPQNPSGVLRPRQPGVMELEEGVMMSSPYLLKGMAWRNLNWQRMLDVGCSVCVCACHT